MHARADSPVDIRAGPRPGASTARSANPRRLLSRGIRGRTWIGESAFLERGTFFLLKKNGREIKHYKCLRLFLLLLLKFNGKKHERGTNEAGREHDNCEMKKRIAEG